MECSVVYEMKARGSYWMTQECMPHRHAHRNTHKPNDYAAFAFSDVSFLALLASKIIKQNITHRKPNALVSRKIAKRRAHVNIT